MIAPVAKAIDWINIQMARRASQRGLSHTRRADEILAEIAAPNFFLEPVNAPADFTLSGEHDFHFTSHIQSPWPMNNRAYGRFYRCGDDWQKRPTVILIHGWNGELNYYTLFPLLAKELAQRQHNTALIILPYHAHRRPSAPGAMRNFISDDIPRVLEATQQAIADVRALAAWLHGQGSPRITVWGFSLGGWLTGLIACLEKRPQRYVLATPIVSMERTTGELPFCEPLCTALKKIGARLDRFDLTAMQPQVTPSDVLLVESIHDLFASADSVEALWKTWNHPEILRLPHGHISVLFSSSSMKKIVDWVAR